jgi:hypothetical protein
MLDMASIPVASGSICKRRRFGRDHKKITSIVLKPLDGNHGKELLSMLKLGRCVPFGFCHKEYSKRIIVEKFITGSTIEYIDNKLVAAAKEFLLM